MLTLLLLTAATLQAAPISLFGVVNDDRESAEQKQSYKLPAGFDEAALRILRRFGDPEAGTVGGWEIRIR